MISTNKEGHLNNIVMIFMGECHFDPAPLGLTRLQMQKFHKLAIPQILCAEESYTQSFEEKFANDTGCDKLNQKLLTGSNYVQLMRRAPELSFPFYSPESEILIKNLFRHDNEHLSSKAGNVARQLVKYLAFKENVLLNEQVVRLKIPYQGIERSNQEHQKLIQSVNAEHNARSELTLFDSEASRIAAMVGNIFEKALPRISQTGGIIWISELGVLHSHNLALSVLNHIQKLNLYKNHSFTLLPLACFSGYTQETTKNEFLNLIPFFFELLQQPNLKTLSNQLPLQVIEDVKETSQHQYSSLNFERAMVFAEKSFQKRNIFHIPTFDDQKRKLIEDNFGIVQKIEDKTALVCIASEILLQPMRNCLGIDRRKLTFKNNHEEKIRQFLCLPQITLEYLQSPQQVIVTFPAAELARVTKLLEN